MTALLDPRLQAVFVALNSALPALPLQVKISTNSKQKELTLFQLHVSHVIRTEASF